MASQCFQKQPRVHFLYEPLKKAFKNLLMAYRCTLFVLLLNRLRFV